MAIIRWKAGAVPEAWAGLCQHVYDGDTLAIGGGPVRRVIRIFGIDAPEWGQRGAGAAWRFLGKLAFPGRIYVSPMALDRFGRIVARVGSYQIADFGLRLVAAGLVWWEYRWAPHETVYREAQEKARAEGRGLWADGRPQFAPWVWRRRHRIGL